MGVDIPFPIIADLDMKVAKRYGMLHPGQSSTSTIRTVFFIGAIVHESSLGCLGPTRHPHRGTLRGRKEVNAEG